MSIRRHGDIVQVRLVDVLERINQTRDDEWRNSAGGVGCEITRSIETVLLEKVSALVISIEPILPSSLRKI